jgi:hypothetical protein
VCTGSPSLFILATPGWDELADMFPEYTGRRQFCDLRIEHPATSCGSGVPTMTVETDRGRAELIPFCAKKSDQELHDHCALKNVESIDGHPTHIFDD